MLKRSIFIAFLFFITLGVTNAQTINGIAAIVDNEPITTFEVTQLKQKLNINDAQALNLLIRDRLEQAQIKLMGISVSPIEINDRLTQIAQQNGLTPAQFRESLAQQGIKQSEFNEELKKALSQEKLYQSIVANSTRNITQERAKEYYEANKNQFETFKIAKVEVLRSTNARALELKASQPNSKVSEVSISQEEIEISKARPELADILIRTNIGSYTPILRSPSGFEVIYIKDKIGIDILPFESVRDAILNQMFNAQRNEAIIDYIEKLRAKAKIKILR